ncbi:MAG TPA: hypothetical protein DIU18_02595 [Gemmatimonadetes bacterium]|nr:hypothetical protein [Gemmatimonadota bacterium]
MASLPGSHPRVLSFPLKVLSSAIVLLMLALLIGFLLPSRWDVERSAVVSAPPAAVFPWLDNPQRWDQWAPLGEVIATFSGPPRGAGASRRWTHPEVGDGVFTILSTILDREVRYRVEVQGGRMVTEGTLRLSVEGTGTRVTWQEQGDFGRNPLLGYLARSMDRMQGAQMEGSLARLGEQVSEAED